MTCDVSQVLLTAGESAEVTMPLRFLPDLAIWSVEVPPPALPPPALPPPRVSIFPLDVHQVHAFVPVAGTFTLEACASSAVCLQSLQLKTSSQAA